jgi:hypothetical protein
VARPEAFLAAAGLLCLSLGLPSGERTGEPPALPWRTGTDYRFVWLRGAEKVGETTFRIREVV